MADCRFCAILAGDAPAQFVLDEPEVAAFLDVRPLFKGHVLVLPRAHYETLADLPARLIEPLFGWVQRISAAMPAAYGAEGSFVAMNNIVSQSVPHLHVHVVPRTKGDGLRGFFWPRGRYVSDDEAAQYARRMRDVLAGSAGRQAATAIPAAAPSTSPAIPPRRRSASRASPGDSAGRGRRRSLRIRSRGEASRPAVQDGRMRETRATPDGLRMAIERSGYYPGLVTDAVSSALGPEPIVSYVVHHDAMFDPGMEVRRHITVLVLTPSRLIHSHTDEHPPQEPDGRPQAETSTEAISFSRISSVVLTRVVPDPASYVAGVTMPTEVLLTISWNVLSHVELEPAHCGDENCEADHGYTGTITADDLALRVSEAADGEESVRAVLSFARALAAAAAGP